jgi:hypothetical protein
MINISALNNHSYFEAVYEWKLGTLDSYIYIEYTVNSKQKLFFLHF